MVAIDDMQWMDSSSAAALRFALRRLRGERVAGLATRRFDHLSRRVPELERILGDDRVTRIGLGPLNGAATNQCAFGSIGTRTFVDASGVPPVPAVSSSADNGRDDRGSSWWR